ncbi:CNNM domain-containing protein [Kushneria indalinina]|uniref:CBS domain containing-hemolysin-like protein n=1 Tax=Kushneria indalinina DSM 14324 TaxID=1122140 RepID=A0A3D9DYQ5_9GAMM|nr:CNNM domain-containing protein [Kushneria indalinina]REC95898.1 CBS domain containing-hemolysin-like protein [Kushneria indalinina DSM 14324]
MVLLIVFAVAAIAISFICSVLEAALLSLTPSHIARLKEDRPALHHSLSQLKDNVDRPLAAILTLNTIAHTAGATGVGAQVSAVFGETWIGVASAIMTLLILVLSEILPKTIGARYWRQLAPILAPTLKTLIWLLLPFIWLSEQITRRIGGGGEDDVDVREEIKALARLGQERGVVDTDESRTIVNILNLHNIRVHEVMTPRTVCKTVAPEMTVAEFDAGYSDLPFTRYPVMTPPEQTVGYVHKMDAYHAADDATLEAIMHPIESVDSKDSVEQVFIRMLNDHHHMCVVYDDHGNWVGVLTMEDILETILGQDIVDETDDVSNLRHHARQLWLKRVRRSREAATDDMLPRR